LKIEMSHDRALCHGFLGMSGTRKGLGKTVRFWLRETMSFERGAGGWQIVHEPRSVPFYRKPGLRSEVDSSRKLRVAWAW
jgi:ketosteroid isomerase-like protein